MSTAASLSPTALTLSSSLLIYSAKRFTFHLPKTSPPLLIRRSRTLHVAMAAASDPLEICVKASTTTPNKIGDCPFTQRVLLTLEEKHLPYNMKLVDLANKPECGSKIFPTFIGFLQCKDPNDGTEQALLTELTSFNDYIKGNGPFINGKDICAVDLSLGPKLYHLEIALGHYKKWSIPESLPYVRSYMKVRQFSRWIHSLKQERCLKMSLLGGVQKLWVKTRLNFS
ncbi:glutathione S-transferase DHAR3, chloroplastic-like isoform X3 [Magnolia sinica]|uniref:glutathione S-transferase DHAR3, chloroplastic-like isoform X3 n=1 Tax=Magnolia sinica TaxID=86752 RepID=UPI0026580A99|nr:glutathione S-transferase DHAR3, chloroplastic-like isoform X3 [Magnolia sinica]